MPIVPTPLPADRRQPEARVLEQRKNGSYTMISDRLGQFCQVKPVAWIRTEGGDDFHWTKNQNEFITAPTTGGRHINSNIRPHPALLEFQAEQDKLALKQAHQRAASIEQPTTNSIYGRHTIPTLPGANPDAVAKVNAIGAEQIAEQQTKLWAPLTETSKRLGFAISQAPPESPLYEIEKAQDRRRFQSTHTVSYTNPTGERVELVIPESMNRTSTAFPLSPVNKYTTKILPGKMIPKEVKKEASSTTSQLEGTQVASTVQLDARGYPIHSGDTSTAHSLGYGKRHTFYRHYLTSAP